MLHVTGEIYDFMCSRSLHETGEIYDLMCSRSLLLDFSLTVKAAPHECVIRTSQP